MVKNYKVQFNLIDQGYGERSIIPVITIVNTAVRYWNDISEEQKQEEIKGFAILQLEDVGVFFNEDIIQDVEIIEL